MKIVLVSKCSLDIGHYAEFKMSVFISPSNSLISSHWVTFELTECCFQNSFGTCSQFSYSHVVYRY